MKTHYIRQLFSDNMSIVFDYHLIVLALAQKLFQYLLLWWSLSYLIKVNSWYSRIVFLVCCRVKVAKHKTISWCEMYLALVEIAKHILFTWIPNHTCIHENTTIIEKEAQDSLDTKISNCSSPCTKIEPFIMKYNLKRCQDSWDQQIHSKLHEMHYLVGKTLCS